MNERHVSTWLLGFTMGCLTSWQARVADNIEKEQAEPAKACRSLPYQAGQADALKINPISI
jgi:hypothetical protein